MSSHGPNRSKLIAQLKAERHPKGARKNKLGGPKRGTRANPCLWVRRLSSHLFSAFLLSS